MCSITVRSHNGECSEDVLKGNYQASDALLRCDVDLAKKSIAASFLLHEGPASSTSKLVRPMIAIIQNRCILWQCNLAQQESKCDAIFACIGMTATHRLMSAGEHEAMQQIHPH